MVTTTSLNLLRSIPCFGNLTPEALAWLLDSVREQCFAKGETVFLEGEPCPGLFVVKSGTVKLYRNSPKGDEHIMRLVYRGGCFECAPIFDRGPNPVSAQALETSELLFIPAATFESLVNSYPDVVLQIVPILAMRLRNLLDKVEDLSFKRVFPRVAKLVWQLAERRDNAPLLTPLPLLTQQHLACIVGCSRQLLNNSLRELVRRGIIKMEKRHIIVLKPESLAELTYSEIIDE
ncbi:MAG: Crp/Fnr family transcriptional regulator [Chloroflexi bacterium]|nr:Crp/Fnr family transcriptional regulator [Chloroflexota bacterium]